MRHRGGADREVPGEIPKSLGGDPEEASVIRADN